MHDRVEIPGFPGSYVFASEAPARQAVVLVHGFLGDSEGTWLDFPRLIGEKAEWAATDVYSFDYESFPSSVGDVADRLLDFVETILPAPAELFETRYPVWSAPGSTAGAATVKLRDASPEYEELILCGHSLGGLVIRTMIRDVGNAYRRRVEEEGESAVAPLPLFAKLRLFAPAIGGARPVGLPGLTLELGGLGTLARALLGLSPSYKAMAGKTTLLGVVRDGTEDLAKQFPKLPGFHADILWCQHDKVVEDVGYGTDVAHRPRPEGTTHTSVCKPGSGYPLPLTFVRDGAKR
jgi:pimeloyl-ACP methyl ester carboxylesterase